MPKAFKGGQPNTPILRGDYQAPAWFVESIELVIQLDPSDTRVRAVLTVTNHTVTGSSTPALQLNGVGLDTGRVLVNDQAVDPSRLDWTDETLTISDLPDHARITTEVRFAPNNNLALEGLYVSGSSMLTQCEAEGFRKITWFPDRPDIMTRFRVRLEAEQARYPILLCNGNLVHAGSLGEGRHFAEW
ncbi:MAG: aminopeptidase N, partial [Pseudomonadota bacterium]